MLAIAPAAQAAEAPPISSTMRTLSGYMSAAATRPLPDMVREKTAQHILDTLAAMISGSLLPPGKFDLKFAREYQDGKSCTIVAADILCGPMEAAMVNALLAHSDETDDSHPGSESHPGSSVVAAALAAGERFGIDGERFLRAVTLGYDIGPRFAATLGKLEYMVSSHRSTHALAGLYGSAAAAGCAAGLNAQQMRWLLSYTAQQASGLASWQRDTDHIEKAFDFAGMAARDGVTAALMVQAGATGVDDILSGADNFFQAFVPLHDPAMVIDGLGERYEVVNTNIKKWTVGSPIQAPLDALEDLMRKHRFTAGEVKSLIVHVAAGEATIVDNRFLPDICLQHMMAIMLVDGTVGFKSAHDVARMKDPAVLRQRAKVQLIHDEALQRLMPARVAVVDVVLNDGSKFSERIDRVKGTIQNPMTHGEVVVKARDLIAPVLGPAVCESLIGRIFALDKLTSIGSLRPLLQQKSRGRG
jgi:2-methylcitrate dehydratase PrpD